MFRCVRDASENPFERHEQKIEATARSASWRERPQNKNLQYSNTQHFVLCCTTGALYWLMLAGTSLTKAYAICDTPEAYISVIERFFNKAFTTADIEKRKTTISLMDHEGKTNLLIQLIS